jgi:hypothetical protein
LLQNCILFSICFDYIFSLPKIDQKRIKIAKDYENCKNNIFSSSGKSTGQVLHLHPHSQFDVILCGKLVEKEKGIEWQQDGQQQCAVGANCAGLYRMNSFHFYLYFIFCLYSGWRRALVRHSHPRMHGGFVQDFVLVPVDCLCVFGWAENFGAQNEPIVLE